MAGRSNSTPWVATHERLVAVAWGATVEGKTDVFLAVSRDAGATFAAPVPVNAIAGEARLGGELPPRVGFAPMPGSAEPEIVVLWTARGGVTAVKTSRSRDGGRTFGPAVSLQGQHAAGDRGWPSLAIGADGTAHAIWLDHRGLAADRVPGAPRPAHRDGTAHDGVAMAQKSALYYAQSGGSATTERELATGVCYCCKTAIATGPGGVVCAAWRHVYPGNLRDMAFTFSRDGGKTFAPPARVSEDGWAINGCPDDGPAIAVGGDGTVHLLWPTVIDGPTPVGALFYASTTDGRAFTPRARVPTPGGGRPSHPQLVVDRRGRIRAAWDELIDGRRVSAVRQITPTVDGAVTVGPVTVLSPGEAASYPVLAATDGGVVAVWSTGGEASAIKVRTLP